MDDPSATPLKGGSVSFDQESPTLPTVGPDPDPATLVGTGGGGRVADMPRFWGSYEIVAFLGRGGMGRVFKAFDPRLKRHVALKLLAASDPELARRMQREAQAQARVDHPRICKVYDVGELDGMPYLSLQFIEGRPLNAAARSMRLDEKVRVLRDVAEALHAAHRMGIIHRDIKPSNILVEWHEEAGWSPFVLDFGLAREMDQAGITGTGEVMGTPHYMAPEQVRGETQAMDRRTDVFSLGATLYELFTDRPPFEGPGPVEVLMAVLNADPAPPRRRTPALPSDLETVVLKCLEKDPPRRYGSARELAEDLDRWLNGEPIQARPATLIYRWGKRARKHRTLVAVALAGLAAAVALGGLWAKSRWDALRQVELAARFGQELREVEGRMRTAMLLPLHDLRADRRAGMERVREMEREVERAGSLAEGPGQYALGRALWVLQDPARARVHLERAWSAGHRTPEAAFTLGSTLGLLYQRSLAEVGRRGGGRSQEAARRELERSLRDPAVRFLREARAGTSASTAFPEALMAFYEKDYPRALELARRAEREDPWAADAWRLQGEVLIEIGNAARGRSEWAEAGARYEEAGRAFETAVEIARSDPAGYEGLCRRWGLEIYTAPALGRSPEPAFRRAVEACDRALAADPESLEALNESANAYKRWGDYLMKEGVDPRPILQQCITRSEAVLTIAPGHSYALLNLGVAFRLLGEYALIRREDPLPYWQKAMDHLRHARALDPGQPHILNNMGMTLLNTARSRAASGLDPNPEVMEGLEIMRQIPRVDPDYRYHENTAKELERVLNRGGYPSSVNSQEQ